MRVLVVTAGTKGDVAPAVCLAKACREQGAEAAAVCTHLSYKAEVVDSGSLFASSPAFFDLGPAPDEALRETPEGQALASAGMFSKMGAAQRFMDPLITKWMDNMLAALMAFRPDVVVLFTLPVFVGHSAIEKATRGVRCLNVRAIIPPHPRLSTIAPPEPPCLPKAAVACCL